MEAWLSGTLPLGILFASCFLSFGGFSVIAQLAGILKDTTLSMRPFLAARALHAVCSSFLVFCYLKLFPQTAAVFSSSSQPLPISNEKYPSLDWLPDYDEHSISVRTFTKPLQHTLSHEKHQKFLNFLKKQILTIAF